MNRKLAVVLVGVLVLGIAGTFAARALVANFYRSDAFRDGLHEGLSAIANVVAPKAVVLPPKVEPRGFFDLTIDAKASSKSGEFSARTDALVDLFPNILGYGPRIRTTSALKPSGSLKVDVVVPAGVLSNGAKSLLSAGLTGSITASDLKAQHWLSPLLKFDAARITDGALSFDLALSESSPATIKIRIERTTWAILKPVKRTLIGEPLSIEVRLAGDAWELAAPAKWVTNAGTIEATGKIQTDGSKDAVLDLSIKTSGTLARGLAAGLLRCSTVPPADVFHVKGKRSAPLCQ